METLRKVSKFAGKYMAIIVLIVAVIAFFLPESFLWVGKDYNFLTRIITVNNLLMVVMFGMGLTLKLDDFKVVFSRPKDVLAGCASQFIIMPLLAFLLAKIFALSPELAVGVILVGTCPGGTSSNVMTFLAKGDVALSVGMTACSTVLAPFLTPALTYLYAHETVTVNMVDMFTSIVEIVIIPIALGFIRIPQRGKAVCQRHPDPVGGHPAQPVGVCAGLRRGQGSEDERCQVQRGVHRGGNAEQRSGHQLSRYGFPGLGPGYCARRSVQRVA